MVGYGTALDFLCQARRVLEPGNQVRRGGHVRFGAVALAVFLGRGIHVGADVGGGQQVVVIVEQPDTGPHQVIDGD